MLVRQKSEHKMSVDDELENMNCTDAAGRGISSGRDRRDGHAYLNDGGNIIGEESNLVQGTVVDGSRRPPPVPSNSQYLHLAQSTLPPPMHSLTTEEISEGQKLFGGLVELIELIENQRQPNTLDNTENGSITTLSFPGAHPVVGLRSSNDDSGSINRDATIGEHSVHVVREDVIEASVSASDYVHWKSTWLSLL
ncbi:expressed unknown protein [Seminavis robusta]|uniref:Uncharacterized protein n=1 Tax=Seminavis robusta TaxID=568900 RepID=A0A9N8F0H2_9STRA|nr:expressed unknown protein [Seminavis robusta]|eukprot:Sro2214_g319350.1 n/a (195) ;mRNA; f:8024-8608